MSRGKSVNSTVELDAVHKGEYGICILMVLVF